MSQIEHFTTLADAVLENGDETSDTLVVYPTEDSEKLLVIIRPDTLNEWTEDEMELVSSKYKELYSRPSEPQHGPRINIKRRVRPNTLELDLELVEGLVVPLYPEAVVYKLVRITHR